MLYRSKLLQDGLSSVEADQVLTGLRAKVMTDSNKHYERQDPQFKTDPNAFLVEIASKLPPGKALDLGMLHPLRSAHRGRPDSSLVFTRA